MAFNFSYLKSWGISTLICFFLYDLMWIFLDFSGFKEIFDGHYTCLFVDFAYCAIFSFSSLLVSQKILKWKIINYRGDYHLKMFLIGIILLFANLLIAGLCEIFRLIVDTDFFKEDIWDNSFFFGLIASNIAMIHLAKHYAHMLIQRENDNIALQKKYLKLQLDPHFVLNSMSSLAGMIEYSPQIAEKYVVKLSHVYRHLLQHIDLNYISIDTAIDFAQDYVELLNLRCNGKIELCAEGVSWKENECILALSVQLLLENAVKHNHPSDGKTLYIRMIREDHMLIIQNNRIYADDRNDQSIESYGIGLENLRQRYSLESDILPEVCITKDSFEVRLPILIKK